jgi:uncharacterized protein
VIFVDTGAWFAVSVPNDADHDRARAWLDGNVQPLVTTDYVLAELLTLLKVRGEFERACRIGAALLCGKAARLEWITRSDVKLAWRIFERHRDKEWSFVDCVSCAVMERLGIETAFAFDRHFRQFGTVTVAP